MWWISETFTWELQAATISIGTHLQPTLAQAITIFLIYKYVMSNGQQKQMLYHRRSQCCSSFTLERAQIVHRDTSMRFSIVELPARSSLASWTVHSCPLSAEDGTCDRDCIVAHQSSTKNPGSSQEASTARTRSFATRICIQST